MKDRLIFRLIIMLVIGTTLFTACATSATPTQTPAASGSTAATATTASGGSSAGPTATTASGSASQGNQKFQGINLRFVGANHPWMDAIKPLIPDFEKQTGMKVTVESYGEDQLTQKLTTEFTAGNSTIDVFMQRPLQEARVMKNNGYYEDLTKYANQDPAYGFSDFTKGAVGTETVDRFLTGIPIVTEYIGN